MPTLVDGRISRPHIDINEDDTKRIQHGAAIAMQKLAKHEQVEVVGQTIVTLLAHGKVT